MGLVVGWFLVVGLGVSGVIKPATKFGGTFSSRSAEHFFSCPPNILIFFFGGGTLIPYTYESGTYFKVQTPDSVKQ